jgi:hypothetical protein
VIPDRLARGAWRVSNEDSQILTVQEVAERLRVAPSFVYGHADQLGAYRVGKYLRFDWNRVTERLRAGLIAASTLGSQPNDLPERP